MVTVKMSSKNQVVIPREARERLGLRPGDRLVVSLDDHRIVMERHPASLTDEIRGGLRGRYGEDVDRYLRQERESWKR